MAKKHVVETDPGILARQQMKNKKIKKILIIFAVAVAFILCCAGILIIKNKIKMADPINRAALERTESYVKNQIIEYENSGGYQGKFELNTFHGYKISSLYEDGNYKAVLICYKLKHNKYNSYISDELYYTLSLFKDGQMISFEADKGDALPTKKTVEDMIK